MSSKRDGRKLESQIRIWVRQSDTPRKDIFITAHIHVALRYWRLKGKQELRFFCGQMYPRCLPEWFAQNWFRSSHM